MRANDINLQSQNTLLPVIPDIAWNITEDDIDTETDSPTFMVIRAYFSNTLAVPPQLVIDSGKTHQLGGASFQSLIRFAYSGEPQYFKGYRVLSEGVDRFGNAITSTPLGSTPSTDILEIKVYGGNGGV